MLWESNAAVQDGCTVIIFVYVDGSTPKPVSLQTVAGFSELKMLVNYESSMTAIVYKFNR